MRTPTTPTLATALALTATLTSCATTTNTTTNTTPNGSPPSIKLTSPAFHTRTLPARYTCDGQNTPPPIQWGTTPPGTSELALYALAINPTPQHRYLITVEYALAGINPRLHHLNPANPPKNTYPGLNNHNNRRYNICPKDKTTHRYQFMIFAIPPNTKISPEYNAQEILAALTTQNTEYTATAHGAFTALYKRK